MSKNSGNIIDLSKKSKKEIISYLSALAMVKTKYKDKIHIKKKNVPS
jgi:hypothetical protein